MAAFVSSFNFTVVCIVDKAFTLRMDLFSSVMMICFHYINVKTIRGQGTVKKIRRGSGPDLNLFILRIGL